MIYKEIIKINNLIHSILSDQLKEFSLTVGQWRVLNKIYLSEHNTITADKLSTILHQDKRTLSLNLKYLEENNFIQRIENTDDKRQKYITLSDMALEIAEDLIAIEQNLEKNIHLAIKNENNFNCNLQSIKEYLINS